MMAYYYAMRTLRLLIGALATLPTAAVVAQVLPTAPVVDSVLRPLGNALDPTIDTATRSARTLADARLARITALVRAYPGRIALDHEGYPARAGEIVLGDADAGVVAAAASRGFTVIERDDVLGVGFVRLSVPSGVSLGSAIRLLKKLGARDVSADQLYTGSGAAEAASPPTSGSGPRVGIIDGGVAGAGLTQRGFAVGAPRASVHGTAIASLITGSGRVRGTAPDARLFAADVYGSDPAGGNAIAIARALGWLVGEHVPVVTISLVGPPNPLLGRVVAAAQARGTIIVAAVGNDGAASPRRNRRDRNR